MNHKMNFFKIIKKDNPFNFILSLNIIKKMEQLTEYTKGISKVWTDIGKTLISAGFITGIILGIVGLVILIFIAVKYYNEHRISTWPIYHNIATISDSYMETATGSVTYSMFITSTSIYELYYRTRVSFVYEIGGKKYVGHQLSYFEPWNTNPMYAKNEIKQYKPGTKVNIRINPNNPAEAYIDNKPYANYKLLAIGLFLCIISLYVVYKS